MSHQLVASSSLHSSVNGHGNGWQSICRQRTSSGCCIARVLGEKRSFETFTCWIIVAYMHLELAQSVCAKSVPQFDEGSTENTEKAFHRRLNWHRLRVYGGGSHQSHPGPGAIH